MPVGSNPPSGYERAEINGYEVVFSAAHAQWLLELHGAYDLTWATTWGERANHSLGPVLGLPTLPVIEIVKDRTAPTAKLASVVEHVGLRDVAWIDDELYEDARVWADARTGRTLLIRTSGYVGMTPDHFASLVAFAKAL